VGEPGPTGAKPLAALLAAQSFWAAADLTELVASGSQTAVVANKLVLLSVVVLVPSLLVFALEYTGRESYVTRRTLVALSVEPVVFTALVWTNGVHGLVWQTLETGGTGPSGLLAVRGPAYTVHTAYSYVVLAAVVFLIVVFALRSRYFYQRQVAAVVVATLVPWGANAVSLALDLDLDLTPVAFTVTGVVFTWAVVREELLDISPIATEVVLERIDTAVVVVDTADRIVDINERASEQLGVAGESVVGDSIRPYLADSREAERVYESVTAGRSPATEEFEAKGRYFRLQSTPLVDRRDDVVGYALIVVDLTDQREREAQLERRNEQLDRFAGVVSHDLRNPLQVAAGNLDLARRTGDPEHFDTVERSHDRMERLVEDLLALARQNEDLNTERVAVTDVAERAWSHVDTAELELVVETDGLSVEVDSERVSQLFENLYRNVVEHAGEDVTVTVETLSDERGFAVTDDGPGFGDADPGAVFEDGYTTSRDGTGFGLSIVAEVAPQHGWSVDATDDDDGGARIEVEFAEKTEIVD